MPTAPAATASAAPASIALPGWSVAADGDRRCDEHGEHEQRARALHRHGDGECQQDEQREPQHGRPTPSAAAPALSKAAAVSGR